MRIHVTINGRLHDLEVEPGTLLINTLRRIGFASVKHGCETGECGACAVLLDGKPVTTCTLLAAQADGHAITTVEAMNDGHRSQVDAREPRQGQTAGRALHPLQQAFVDTGAIQCGYCTPAMLAAAQELLAREPNPGESQVRDALSRAVSKSSRDSTQEAECVMN